MLDEQTPDLEDDLDEPTPEFVPTLDDDDSDIEDFVPDEMPQPCWALMGFVAARAELPVLTFKPAEKGGDPAAPRVNQNYSLLCDDILECLEDRPAMTYAELEDETESTSVPKAVRKMVKLGICQRVGRYVIRTGDQKALDMITEGQAKSRGLRGLVVRYLREHGGKALTRDIINATASDGGSRVSVGNALGDMRRAGMLKPTRTFGLVELSDSEMAWLARRALEK